MLSYIIRNVIDFIRRCFRVITKPRAKLTFPFFDFHIILIKDLFPNYRDNRSLQSIFDDLKLNITSIRLADPPDKDQILADLIRALEILSSDSDSF